MIGAGKLAGVVRKGGKGILGEGIAGILAGESGNLVGGAGGDGGG
jgi:hypothetical protein